MVTLIVSPIWLTNLSPIILEYQLPLAVEPKLSKTPKENNPIENTDLPIIKIPRLIKSQITINKGDTLMILIKQDPHDPLLNILNEIWEQEGIFIIIYNLDRLQYNILEHEYVPKHTILKDEEVVEFKKTFNINKDNQIPQISRYDPVAIAIGLRPGQICKIIRPSKTAITADYYRICSQ